VTIPGSGETETEVEAAGRAAAFYSRLEELVKRYQPEAFAPSAADTLHRILPDRNTWSHYPPHMVVNSVEANCAYFRRHRSDPLTESRFNEILNHYKDYHDPYVKYVLRELKSLDLFALATAREQFELQRVPTLHDFARTLLLYERGNPLPRSSAGFARRTGFTFGEWIYMCLAVHAHVLSRRPPVVHPDNYINSEIASIPRDAVNPFFQAISATPLEVGAHFRESRAKYPPYLHIFIRSAFFDKPLLALPGGAHVVVHPHLVFHAADEGLYAACTRDAPDDFYSEFGPSFESYVGALLCDMFSPSSVFTESRLQGLAGGRTCDFLVLDGSSTLLVECKATRYSADLLTQNAILNDNSTGKVADGIEQLLLTASRVRSGDYAGIGAAPERPIAGLVATYGELHFANSEYYFDNFVSRRLHEAARTSYPGPFASRPQVINVEAFERLLVMARERGSDVNALIHEKLATPYTQTGDWSQYLFSAGKDVTNWEIPILDNTAKDFLRDRVGIPWQPTRR
jgi:hypothetical protein